MITTSEIRVRYGETDQMGVAYHAEYLVWCEVGRTDFIRALGVTYAEMERRGVLLAVAEATVRYHASARYDDVVVVATRLESVQSRSCTFAYELRRADPAGRGARLATARTMLVSVNRDGRPLALPAEFRALLDGARHAGD